MASRQDISLFDSKQSSASASITVGMGASGSASISQDKMKSDYAAVQEQSGLFAGKDGFEIKVKKNTDLNGAVIASKSDEANNKLSTGTLTQKDINNHAEYSASSVGLGGGFSVGGTEKKPDDSKSTGGDQAAPASGLKPLDAGPSGVTPTAPVALSAGENGSSTSKSAIAKAQITIADETKQKELTGNTAAETIASLSRDTDSAQQKLANDFKADKINELFSATKLFLQEGSTFMANRTAEADAAKKALDGTSASLKAEQAKPQDQQNQALISQLDAQVISLGEQKTEADKWMPGGSYGRAMTALQAAVGGNVSGGVNGLLQNASVAYLQSMGAEQIKEIANSFQTKKGEENQTSQNVRAALHAIASCAGATASGSNCSSAAVGAASSVVINNVLSEIKNTNADKMTAGEKEKRKNLVGSIITGIVAVADGNAAAANNAAQIEMENNYLNLSDAEKKNRAKSVLATSKDKKALELAKKTVDDLAAKDVANDLKVLQTCEGAQSSSAACQSARTEVENAKKEYENTGPYNSKASQQFGGEYAKLVDLLGNTSSSAQHQAQINEAVISYIMTSSGVDRRTAQSYLETKQGIEIIAGSLAGLFGGKLEQKISQYLSSAKANATVETAVAVASTKKVATETKPVVTTCVDACFVAGTLVETSAGLKAIETLTGGELVWSRSDETGEYGFRPVIATKATADQTIYHLQVRNSAGVEESFRTTAEHPFWIQDQGWLKASLLAADMILLDRHNQPLTVTGLSEESVTETVFNIQVAEFQTYHIGEFGVWVHNADCCKVTQVTPITPSVVAGNLSKSKLGRAIELDTVTQNQKLMISDVMANGDKFGVKTEALVNDVLKSDPNISVLSGTKYKGENGLDHVVQFTDPQSGKQMTMVIDSKQLAKSGSTKLDPEAAGGVMQLSDRSLEVIRQRLGPSSPAAQALKKAIASGTLVKAVAYVDKATGQLKIVPVNVP